jgi:Ring hydroxylating alpha subunit (catalytic domain)
VTFKEFSLQDGNTLEATHTMLKSRVVDKFPLCDQEILCRHLHKVVRDWVSAYHG